MKKLILVVSLCVMVFGSISANATHRYSKIISDRYKTKICYGFTQGIDQVWHQVLSQAITNYNSAGIDNVCYNPSETSSPYDATFVVLIDVAALGVGTFIHIEAQADFPSGWSNIRPGAEIVVNSSEANSLSYNEKVAMLMHEIGHTLGIRHTNENAGKIITSTQPDNNPGSSIFKSGSSNGQSPTFSQYDIIALDYLLQ